MLMLRYVTGGNNCADESIAPRSCRRGGSAAEFPCTGGFTGLRKCRMIRAR